MLLGAHESIAGGVSRAFARAEEHGAESLQIFTRSARGWTSPPLSEEERTAFKAEAKRTGLPAVAHASYLVNLATEDAALRKKSLDGLWEELSRCEALGVASLILHPGSHPDEQAGTRLVAEAINGLHVRAKGFKSRLCLEVTAGQGSSLGWRFEQIAAILDHVKAKARVGICLDTCHLFAAGYDLSSEKGCRDVLAEFDTVVGVDKVCAFHLNDCKKELGCRVDRHEELGVGTLGLAPFRVLVNDERFRGVPAVLETPSPERYAEALGLLKGLRRQ